MNDVARLIRPLWLRIINLVARGTVKTVNAGSKMQSLQVALLAGEPKDAVEHFEPYGFTSHPKVGAEAVVLFIEGDRSHGIVVVTADRRYRLLNLAEGEVALFDDQGQKVHLTRNGIVIDGAGKDLTIQNTPTITMKATTKIRMETALLEVTGDIRDRCATYTGSMYQMRTIYNGHTQNDPQGGAVGTPNQQM